MNMRACPGENPRRSSFTAYMSPDCVSLHSHTPAVELAPGVHER